MLILLLVLITAAIVANRYNKSRLSWTLGGLVALILALRLFWLLAAPERARMQMEACERNEKDIQTALEMYSTDNQGHYPRQLNLLTPNYLRQIPQCPVAHSDTYSATFELKDWPDAYTIWCHGSNHTAGGERRADYPMRYAPIGLILP